MAGQQTDRICQIFKIQSLTKLQHYYSSTNAFQVVILAKICFKVVFRSVKKPEATFLCQSLLLSTTLLHNTIRSYLNTVAFRQVYCCVRILALYEKGKRLNQCCIIIYCYHLAGCVKSCWQERLTRKWCQFDGAQLYSMIWAEQVDKLWCSPQ